MESLTAAIARLLNSPGFKFLLICGLILILTVPLLLVWSLISEREQRAESVRQTVAQEWGASQYIDGPLLIVPYTVKRVTGEGDKRVEELIERRAVFLPKSLKVNGKATTKVLHRSIYDVAVYTGLPTILGWDVHEGQQRTGYPSMLQQRANDVERAYSSTNPADAMEVIRTYDVRWVVIGGLERAYYPSAGLDKFANMPEFRLAYDHDGVQIYEVVSSSG